MKKKEKKKKDCSRKRDELTKFNISSGRLGATTTYALYNTLDWKQQLTKNCRIHQILYFNLISLVAEDTNETRSTKDVKGFNKDTRKAGFYKNEKSTLCPPFPLLQPRHPWRNNYLRKNWKWWPEFKFWTKFSEFQLYFCVSPPHQTIRHYQHSCRRWLCYTCNTFVGVFNWIK